MPKKCPPNTLCIENYTMFFILLFISLLFIAIFYFFKNNVERNNESILQSIFSLNKQKNTQYNQDKYYNDFDNSTLLHNTNLNKYFTNPNYVMSDDNSIYLNPYMPPLKSNFFYDNLIKNKLYQTGGNVNLAPINIPTSHYDFDFKQVGILTRSFGQEMILPLFGRPLHSNRNKWQYYTTTNTNNIIKLPVSRKGKSCTGDYGCDEIFNGDTLYVEGYKDSFKATIYENNTPRYIPF